MTLFDQSLIVREALNVLKETEIKRLITHINTASSSVILANKLLALYFG